MPGKVLHFKSQASYARYLAYGKAHNLLVNKDKIFVAGKLIKNTNKK